MKFYKIIVWVLPVLFFVSCNSTRITDSWTAKDTVPKDYHNIMVWGILTEKDSLLKENMETHLVNDLVGKGYHAISSLKVFGSRAFTKLTEKEIVEQFKNSGVDAVITITLLSKSMEEVYVPAGIVNNGVNNGTNPNRVENYYSSIYDRVFKPGYYTTTTSYFLESNLFEVSGDKLVYSVRTKSFDPLSSAMLAHETGQAIIKDMVRKKIILDLVTKDD